MSEANKRFRALQINPGAAFLRVCLNVDREALEYFLDIFTRGAYELWQAPLQEIITLSFCWRFRASQTIKCHPKNA
jgi:hypothetical protein